MIFVAVRPVAKHRSVCQFEEIHNFFSTARVKAKVGCFQKVMFKLNEKSDVFVSSVLQHYNHSKYCHFIESSLVRLFSFKCAIKWNSFNSFQFLTKVHGRGKDN